MQDISVKYNLLDYSAKEEVNDFIEFLLSRRKQATTSLAEYKKRILNVSVWSAEDIKELVQIHSHLSRWKVKEW